MPGMDENTASRLAASKEKVTRLFTNKVKSFQEKQKAHQERLTGLGINLSNNPTSHSINETEELKKIVDLKNKIIEERNLEISFLKQQKQIADEEISLMKRKLDERQIIKKEDIEKNEKLMSHLEEEIKSLHETLREKENSLLEMYKEKTNILKENELIKLQLDKFTEAKYVSVSVQTDPEIIQTNDKILAALSDGLLPEESQSQSLPSSPFKTNYRSSLNVLSSEQLKSEQKRAQELEKKLLELSAERKLLLSQLEDEKHRSEILSHEVDSLPEYIEVYHNERKSLQMKFIEKDEKIKDLTFTNVQLKQLLENLELVIRNISDDNDKLQKKLGMQTTIQTNEQLCLDSFKPNFVQSIPSYTGIDFSAICTNCKGVLLDV